MRLSRRFFENWVETLEDQAELNRRTLQGLRELAKAQSEVFDELSRESLDAYDGFLDSLSDYHEEVAEDRGPEGLELLFSAGGLKVGVGLYTLTAFKPADGSCSTGSCRRKSFHRAFQAAGEPGPGPRKPARGRGVAAQRRQVLDQTSAFALPAPVELGLRVHSPGPRPRGQPPRHQRAGDPIRQPVVHGQGSSHRLQP